MTVSLQWVDKIYVGQHEVTEVYLWNTLIRPEWWPSPVWNPWIYHNTVSGILSISDDGTNWMSIADYDLDYWDIFQRGNNCPYSNMTSTINYQRDVSAYWPWNYFYSTEFYEDISYSDWANPHNDDLRWGVTDTESAMQWPCPNGFNVWSYTFWNDLITMLNNMGWNDVQYLFMLWHFGLILRTATWVGNTNLSYMIRNSNDTLDITSASKSLLTSIRPVCNTPVVPDDSGDRTVLYQPI